MASPNQQILRSPFPKKYYLSTLLKIIAILGITIYLFSILVSNNQPDCPNLLNPLLVKCQSSSTNSNNLTHTSPTKINHLMFGLLGSAQAWKHRKSYIESWWRPNITRGYLYLDTAPLQESLPWSKSSPPLRISDDISKLIQETNHVAPVMARMNHAIYEIFREEHEYVRWIVMGDDDSIFFVDNWVKVLGEYDHTKYFYIGGQSETTLSNFLYSFDQGFGGAGFALSFPLAKALAENMDLCLRRYPYLNSADLITMSCVADLGVSLTPHKGIHQIDLVKDISGFLSSHPQAPLLSLHHFDVVKPIFPTKDRFDSTNHLMKAANYDQSRLLQQTICYNKKIHWTFSVSWGYSTHIYETIIPRSILKKPIETFRPWVKNKEPFYMFNTRTEGKDSCQTPHIFYLDTVKQINHVIVTSYVRAGERGLVSCSTETNNSADGINKIQVFSPASKPLETGKCECCDIKGHVHGADMVEVNIRPCSTDEIIA